MKRVISVLWIERLSSYAVWALYATPTITIIAWASRTRSPRTAAAILLTFILVVFLVAAITRTWRRFFLMQFPLCLLGVAFAIYTIAFDMPPGPTLAGILAFTSPEEVRGFVGTGQGHSFILLLGLWSVCYIVSASFTPARPIFTIRGALVGRAVIVLLVAVVAYAAGNPSQLIEGIALEPVVGSLMFLSIDIPRVKAEMRSSDLHKIPYRAQHSEGEEVHVLIIGESARRDSWSVYGYERPTTPYLDTLRNEAVFLLNAIADANFTSRSVPIMLTGMTPENFEITKVRGNIFDLAKECGYAAVLLENQDPNAVAAAGVDADLIESPMDFSGSVNGRHTLDEELLPAFRREIARSGKARFIAIHTMGSHWEYFNRYPANFQRFGSPKQLRDLSIAPMFQSGKNMESVLVDAYDNTVLYTDWLLRQIIEQARELAVPATVTFFPDHGEDLQLLDGQSGHGQPVYTPHAFEIPAFVWANEAYRKLHPGIVAALRNNAAKEIRSHNVFYTVADLMGIRWPEAISAKSFASDSFVPDTTMRHIAGGRLVVHPQSPTAPIILQHKLAAAP